MKNYIEYIIMDHIDENNSILSTMMMRFPCYIL